MTKNRLQDTQKRGKTGFGAYKRARKYATILGINVDSTEPVEVLKHVSSSIGAGRKFLVVTPNPEIVMLAARDTVLSGILNSAEVSLPDGVGLVWASRWKAFCARSPFARKSNSPVRHLSDTDTRGFRPASGGDFNPLVSGSDSDFSQNSSARNAVINERVSGVDTMQQLVKLASQRGWRVFLLGGKPGVAKAVADKLTNHYPLITIHSSEGPWLDNNGKPVSKLDKRKEKEVVKNINDFGPELLFVGFGAPKQEKWVSRNLRLLNVNCAMVVGGALDYISGRVPRAPQWMRRLGMEWLFRLVVEPWRIFRQLALLKFVWLVITKG